ncbi:MAG: tail fiber protein [Pseudomonadota bacterium]
MTSIHAWSKVADDNGNIDPAVNFAEFQTPSSVNNSARAVMARVKEWLLDIGKAHVSTGEQDTYEVSMDSTPLALVDGISVLVRPHQDNGGASTLKVNELAAKPLRAKAGVELREGEILQDVPFMAVYDLAGDQFIIHGSGVYARSLFPDLINGFVLNNIFPVGAVVPYAGETVPTGWLECDGSSLAVDDFLELHAKIGFAYGGSDTNFNLPDYRGEFLRGFDNGAGNDPDAANRTDRGDGTAGDAVGTKQDDELRSHEHTGTSDTAGNHTHGYDASTGTTTTTLTSGAPAFPGNAPNSKITDAAGQHSHNITVEPTGGSETRPRNVSVKWIIFAKPQEALAEFQGLTGLPYQFDAGLADVDPGVGQLAFNDADITQATELYINETGPNNEAFGPVIDTWDDLGGTPRAFVFITKVGVPATFRQIQIDSDATDQGAYKKFTISGGTGQGTIDPGDNLNVIVDRVSAGGTGGVDGTVSVQVDNTNTLAPGSDATVENIGDAQNVQLVFGIPQGDQGDPGDPGADGDPGPPGQDGQPGVDGEAASIQIGIVNTLPPGSAATVENVGDAQDAVLNFGIPQGDDGAPGAPGAGSGDVLGPNGAVTGNFAAFNGTTGKVLQDSEVGPNGPFDAQAIASGQFANARISEASVTQHQGALSINASQVAGLPVVLDQASEIQNDSAAPGANVADALSNLFLQPTRTVGGDHTLELTDNGKLIFTDSGGANLVTIPEDSTVDFPIGSHVDVIQIGNGATTFAADGSAVLNSAGGNFQLTEQFSAASLIKFAADEWLLIGDLTGGAAARAGLLDRSAAGKSRAVAQTPDQRADQRAADADLVVRIERIERAFDTMGIAMGEHDNTLDNHEARIRVGENWRLKLEKRVGIEAKDSDT